MNPLSDNDPDDIRIVSSFGLAPWALILPPALRMAITDDSGHLYVALSVDDLVSLVDAAAAALAQHDDTNSVGAALGRAAERVRIDQRFRADLTPDEYHARMQAARAARDAGAPT